ncbi:hypothetical protein [Mycobacterium sp. 48b]|uniref:hypothetical protein n=1 Tax=Mycobacterium sp. 48b TaxID=3400426 RepID=UPI003AAFC188
MALNEYNVEIDGHKTTLQLSDEDAKAMGLAEPAPAKAAPTKGRTAANKSRTAANKSGNAG